MSAFSYHKEQEQC